MSFPLFFVSLEQMKGYVEIEKYKALEAESKAAINALTEQVEYLTFQLAELKRMVFGARSERYIPDSPEEQLSLFGAAVKAPPEEKVSVPSHERNKSKAKKKPVRLVLPEHLKREEQVIEPDIDLTNMVRIGEERTEMLHYTPAELSVRVIIRPKYAPKAGTTGEKEPDSPIAIADLPSRFIDKCIADESLLRVILTDKYLDHLPLYRIAARFERLGMVIAHSTMCGWVGQSADRVKVLYNKLIEVVLAADYLQVDETRMEVLPGKGNKSARGKPKKRKTHRGYLWGYHAVHNKLIFFDYSPTREADNPVEHLEHFDGILQTDCYGIYDQIRKLYPDVTHYHCLGHSRREFEKALGNDARRAGHGLEQFQLLYAVERKAREQELDADGIYALRQKEARPVLEELFEWMEEESPKLPPKSPIGKAMGYMLKRKRRMMHYLDDGNLLIDTNSIENLIRPIAVGRRNYLFAVRQERSYYDCGALLKMREPTSRSRLTGAGFKLPYAA